VVIQIRGLQFQVMIKVSGHHLSKDLPQEAGALILRAHLQQATLGKKSVHLSFL